MAGNDRKVTTDNEGQEKKEPFDWKKELKEDLILVAAVVAVVLVINNVFLINARIPSASMENTVMTHDRIFGNRLAYNGSDPERFDIVIFRYPDDEKRLFIKRIIGLPGETVTITDGKVYINGSSEPLDDSFCKETPRGTFGTFEVPEGCYFMLGDNRNNSNDSRFWDNHYVAKEKILGKAWVRYWPLNKIGKIG
ncbi:MAG: signal peptidase I [Lachnospiraceae bacterium]|nr:signal peptidase I [Lachnospiraceae bacterium]